MLTLVFWWQELAIWSLTCVFLFLLLGQKHTMLANAVLGLGFAILCYLVLLAFPAGAIFSVPIIALYCLAFFITSTNRKEFWWKTGTTCLLAAAMVTTKIPTFVLNLYAYSWGSYFVDLVSTTERLTTAKWSSLAISQFEIDPRITLVIALSLGTASFIVVRGSGPLRRLAFSVVFVEFGIILLGVTNALTLNYPIASFYSEIFHTAFLVAFFMVFLLFVCTVLVMSVATFEASVHSTPAWAPPAYIRPALVWAVPLAAVGYYALFDKTPAGPLKYPPAQPASVQILRKELELKPGQPFRGRVLVLAGMQGAPGNQWMGGPGSISDILEFHYRPILGNDHYIHLLAFGISVATDFGHWTSPVTFVFLRKFFGRKDDVVPHKSFFPLRAFNNRIARLLGIRMVVTDAPSLPGSSLVYETKVDDADLRIFRIDNVNLGEYSPTRAIRISTAAEAIAALAMQSFDPERDVIVEQEILGNLFPAASVSIITDLGPTLSIRADSSGQSLLVLPFEYSHCLSLDVQEGTSAQLISVNLQQTGLLFDKELRAKLFYRFGPFDHPECRRADQDRADRLRLRDAL
jgi:hypothetical protein